MEPFSDLPAQKRARISGQEYVNTFVSVASHPQTLNPAAELSELLRTLPSVSPPLASNPLQPGQPCAAYPASMQQSQPLLQCAPPAPPPPPAPLLQPVPPTSTTSAAMLQMLGGHGSTAGAQMQAPAFPATTQMQAPAFPASPQMQAAPILAQEGAGQQPALQKDEFTIGQQVEMRNDDNSAWSTGYVTSLQPLSVAYSKDGMGIPWKFVRSQASAQQEAMRQQQEALQQQQYMQQLALQQHEAMQQAAMQQQAMQYSMQWSMQQQQAALQQARTHVRPPQQLPAPPAQMSAADQGTDVVDHYGALDVETSSDEATVKKAYRKLVLKWHPDKHPADREQAEVKIRAINEAYEVISNSTKRAAYDAQREAIERLKQGARLPVDLQAQPRHDIPREFMLMPMGWPDKFIRYSGDVDYSGSREAHCFVHSRCDAKMDGGLAYFEPFFQACKLSLWWLPQVKNMCRIRAIEARTRSTRGEAVVAGRAGGMNLGFYLDLTSMTDSGVVLMDARKGEKDEHVNFIVQPSPWYSGAWRFEAASRPGWFLCFQPPTYLRMVAQDSKAISHAACILDFTLVDFLVMYKFIDIAEILGALLQNVPDPGWITLEQLKCQPSVADYFTRILQVPTWSDEDFQTYFEGHYDTWEFCATPCCMVRLRRKAQVVTPHASNVLGFPS